MGVGAEVPLAAAGLYVCWADTAVVNANISSSGVGMIKTAVLGPQNVVCMSRGIAL